MGNKTLPNQEKPVRGDLLTVPEAAKYMRIGRTTVYDMVEKCEIRCLRGKRGVIRLDTADLDDYLQATVIPADTVSK